MIIIIAFIVICMIIGGKIGSADYGEGPDILLGAFMAGLIGMIPSFLIGGMISVMLFGAAPMQCVYSRDLIALKDNTSVSGSFFLGCGNVDSEMNYIYATETEKGITTVTIEKDTNEVYIKYTDGQPHLEYWVGSVDWLRIPEEPSYYVFYVPQGSVVNAYKMDLE